jgi:hypothetical protein
MIEEGRSFIILGFLAKSVSGYSNGGVARVVAWKVFAGI